MLPFFLFVLVPVALAVLVSITGLLLQKPRTWGSYLAVFSSLVAAIVLIYILFPSAQNPLLKARAVVGDLQAQYELGERYLRGHSIPEDTSKGVYWLTRAAKGGQLAAQLALGDYYHTVRDRGKARFWLETLANSDVDGWERSHVRDLLHFVRDDETSN